MVMHGAWVKLACLNLKIRFLRDFLARELEGLLGVWKGELKLALWSRGDCLRNQPSLS